MGAPKGNKNAAKSKRGRSRKLIGISGPTLDLLYDALALEGNADPSYKDLQNAIYYAIRQVYGRKIEEETIII